MIQKIKPDHTQNYYSKCSNRTGWSIYHKTIAPIINPSAALAHLLWYGDRLNFFSIFSKIFLSHSTPLSNESQYEGGELEIRDWKGENIIAPKRLGSAIVFDSKVTHRAKPVTEGERIVLVGWASGPKLR